MDLLKKKGQGAFEYILILAGVLFIVVLAILLLNQVSNTGGQQAAVNDCVTALAGSSKCVSSTTGLWTSSGIVAPAPAACVSAGNNYPNVVDSVDACGSLPATSAFLLFKGTVANSWCCGTSPK